MLLPKCKLGLSTIDYLLEQNLTPKSPIFRVASTITYPLQVAKSRMQQRSEFVELTSDGDVRVVKRRYLGFLVTMRRIWTKEGMAGFFRGCIPNAVRVAPSAAVTFVVYEAVLDFLLSNA